MRVARLLSLGLLFAVAAPALTTATSHGDVMPHGDRVEFAEHLWFHAQMTWAAMVDARSFGEFWTEFTNLAVCAGQDPLSWLLFSPAGWTLIGLGAIIAMFTMIRRPFMAAMRAAMQSRSWQNLNRWSWRPAA